MTERTAAVPRLASSADAIAPAVRARSSWSAPAAACGFLRRSVACGLLPGALLAVTVATGCSPKTTVRDTDQEAAVLARDAAQASQLQDAQAAAASGDYDRALSLFRELLAENALLTEAYMGIGDIYRQRGEYEQAEPAYARAARLEPRNFDAQYLHGVVLQALDRFVDAIRAYHRALTIRPDDFGANANMATVYLEVKDPASAVIFAEKAVALRPDDGAARVNLGTAYAQTGRYNEAITQYETAMELLEPTPELMLSLVNAYGEEKRYQEAVNAALTLTRVAPSANAFERLGWAYFRLARYQESLQAYRDAVALDSNHYPSLNGIGVNALNAWLLSNKSDPASRLEARNAFRQSLRANPDQPKVVQLLTTYQL